MLSLNFDCINRSIFKAMGWDNNSEADDIDEFLTEEKEVED
jgi:hypothetical protein